MSLKVIGTETDRSDTYDDFLLTFHSNYGLHIFTVYKKKNEILAENIEFSPHNSYLTPRRGGLLELGN